MCANVGLFSNWSDISLTQLSAKYKHDFLQMLEGPK